MTTRMITTSGHARIEISDEVNCNQFIQLPRGGLASFGILGAITRSQCPALLGYCSTSLLYGYEKGRFPRSEPASDLGGAKGIRTPDLLHAMQTRYQLRHSPATQREAPSE